MRPLTSTVRRLSSLPTQSYPQAFLDPLGPSAGGLVKLSAPWSSPRSAQLSPRRPPLHLMETIKALQGNNMAPPPPRLSDDNSMSAIAFRHRWTDDLPSAAKPATVVGATETTTRKGRR
jgi:hypothetical protein